MIDEPDDKTFENNEEIAADAWQPPAGDERVQQAGPRQKS
jgi:hypothetical protein